MAIAGYDPKLDDKARYNAETTANPPDRSLCGTRLSFMALCCYLLSQAIQIPLIAVGPSWAIWPTISDFVVPMLVVAYLIEFRNLKLKNQGNRSIYGGLMLIIGGSVLWFFASYMFTSLGKPVDASQTTYAAIYQVYRLAQFVIVFRVVAGIPMNVKRLRVVSIIVDAVLIAVVAGVVGTASGALRTNMLAAHLPGSLAVAGPWAFLQLAQLPDVGTMGYNHAYTSLQILMLLGLSLSLRSRKSSWTDSALIMASAAGMLLTQSRAGLAGLIFYLFVYFAKKPTALITSVTLVVVALLSGVGILSQMDMNLDEAMERAMSIKNPLDPDNLSGRDAIWEDSIGFLQENPVRWIIGAGPGSVKQLEYNAHMLYLQIIMECGIIGLFIFGIVMQRAIRYLRQSEMGVKPILLVTYAFLITSLTQETFYPVPALGHFVGLYLCSLAIVLGVENNKRLRRQRKYPCA